MSVPASSASENEDAVVVGEDAVVVVDGAGLPAQLRTGCVHSVAWFARSIATTFHRQLGDRSTSMRDALAETIAGVRDSHGASCHLDDGSPSATVAAWRIAGDHVEYLVLCDATIVLADTAGGATAVTDRRLQEVLEVASRTARVSSPDSDDPRVWRRAAVEAARNMTGGFWCVQDDPAAAMHSMEGQVPLRALSGVVACSDGATRAYDLLGTHTLEAFARNALRGDAATVAASIRQAETAQTGNLERQGVKIHDDLTIVAQPLRPAGGSRAPTPNCNQQ